MAFNIEIPEFVIEQSKKFVNNNNLGMRPDDSNGNKEQQLVGVIGQNMMALALGKPFMQPTTQHDNGVDFELFGLKIDIKTMGRTVDPKLDFVNNLIASQIKFDADGYVFASLNKTTKKLTICGWTTKQNFLKNAIFYKKGTIRTRTDNTTFEMKADTYEIENNKLNYSPKNWAELFITIYHDKK